MKKIFGLFIIGFLLGTATHANAQDKDTTTLGQDIKHGAKKVGHGVKKGAKKVGNETAEIASKGKATVTDEVYKDKVGPEDQKIYIDNHSKYYWIDEKGHRHYVSKAVLKNK